MPLILAENFKSMNTNIPFKHGTCSLKKSDGKKTSD